jgi:hypothetical protein
MPSPIKMINDLFSKMNPFSSKQGSTQRGKVYPNKMNRLYEFMQVEEDRRKSYEECWIMYVQDARIAAALDTTAGSATNGGFTMQFNRAKTSESIIKDSSDIIDDIIRRTNLMKIITNIAKELLILGDVFMEVIIDEESKEIVGLKKLPAKSIERVEDEFGTLEKFQQRNDLQEIITTFETWQILHMRWNHFSGQKYGTSMLRPVRGAYKKLKMVEEDLVIRRRTRAGVKLHHYGSEPTSPLEPEEVDEYRTANTTSPLNVRTDWYSNGKWKIDVLKSDDGVSQIDDVKHLEDILLIGLRTPKGLLGIGEDPNRATLERQEVAYIRLLNEVSGEIGLQLTQLFNLGLQLKGINSDVVEYKTIWQERTIEDVNKRTERLVLLGNTGYISRQTATEEIGYNYEDEQLKIEAEQKKIAKDGYPMFVDPLANPTISKTQIPNKPKNTSTGAADK